MNAAVAATDLSKSYKLYDRPIDRFLELFTRRPRHRVFPALQEVSFEIGVGETVGLIGQNGAGKSTLLKLLCGVAVPSSGRLETRGTIASILELGTGFHPDFTGRDNAALNAAILGLSSADIREKLPAMFDFSELGSFLDQPVKTYSSGMYMRLAFSIAVNADPDILIIDEALAVGDGHFQKKCIDKIRDFQRRRKTIVFCSHALYYISTLCERALWLDRGSVRRLGPSVDVVHDYETFLMSRDREESEKPATSAEEIPADEPVKITDLWLADSRGERANQFRSGEDITVRLRITSDRAGRPIHLMVGVLRAADEMQCFAVGTHDDGLQPFSGKTSYDIALKLQRVPLLRGDYAVVVYAGDENAMHVYDRKDIRPAFSMSGERYEVGLINVSHSWDGSTVEAPSIQRRTASR